VSLGDRASSRGFFRDLHCQSRGSIFLARCKSETLFNGRAEQSSCSVCCRSIGIRREQSPEELSTGWPHSKIELAPPPFAPNRLAESFAWCGGRVGALAMRGNGDGEGGLKDLDSALSFGAGIEEIAVCFSGAKSRLNYRPSNAIGRLRVDSESRKPHRRTREPLGRSGTQPPRPRRSDSRGNASQIDLENVEFQASKAALHGNVLNGFKKKGCRQVEKVGLKSSRLHPAEPWRRPW
jgi:hypothetical protein